MQLNGKFSAVHLTIPTKQRNAIYAFQKNIILFTNKTQHP